MVSCCGLKNQALALALAGSAIDCTLTRNSWFSFAVAAVDTALMDRIHISQSDDRHRYTLFNIIFNNQDCSISLRMMRLTDGLGFLCFDSRKLFLVVYLGALSVCNVLRMQVITQQRIISVVKVAMNI